MDTKAREAFEALANARFHNPVKRADGGYNFTGGMEAWDVWQVAWNARAAHDKAALAEVRDLAEAAKAYRDLATCYRVGRKPTESLFRRLTRADAALDKLMGDA